MRRATKWTAQMILPTPYFYPRSPCGERPVAASTSDVSESISIHALLAESDTRKSKVNPTRTISIHALLAESDQTKAFKVAALRISIHALLAESDQFKYVVQCRKVIFLSTLSLRRATIDTSKDVIKTTNFYPRSPCGERQFKLWRA